MSKQAGKCSVFTKDNLPKIQDKMRDKCIQDFNKEMADNLFINGIMNEKEYNSVINKKEKNRDDYER